MILITAILLTLAAPLAYEKPIHTSFDTHHNYILPIEEQHSDVMTYEEIINEAAFNCPGLDPDKINYELLEKLIKIEESFNTPPAMRGMILAAACMESKYNPDAEGDKKFSRNKKTPMAIGILQLWPIYEKMFPGLDRRNPESAANSWMKHIVKQIPKVKRMCGYKTDRKVWLAAWVTGIRYKKKGGRCKEAPLHYRLLKRWHRNIKKQREWKMSRMKNVDGC